MRLVAIIAFLSFAGSAAAQTIVAANYIEPTDRYAHGILGDAIEHAGLEVMLSDGSKPPLSGLSWWSLRIQTRDCLTSMVTVPQK